MSPNLPNKWAQVRATDTLAQAQAKQANGSKPKLNNQMGPSPSPAVKWAQAQTHLKPIEILYK